MLFPLVLLIKSRAAQEAQVEPGWIPEAGTKLGHVSRALADLCLPLAK